METELKFEVDPATADRLLEELGLAAKGEELILRSIYYDTAKADLRGQGIALRVRDDGKRRIQTVKQTTHSAIARGEWEAEIAGLTPDLAAAGDSPLGKALGAKGGAGLKPAFEVTVERARRDIVVGDGVVEVALDRGAVSADGYGAPICELELELKSGAPALLFELARTLSQNGPLELSFLTKAERGYALMDGAALSPARAKRPVLARKATAGQAFQAIGASALAQITANARVLRAARRPEAVHQLRVGVRRLRTAIGLFGAMLADDQRTTIKAELKWVSAELDAARNIDVFIAETFRPAAAARPRTPGMAALGAGLLRAQTEAYDRAELALRSPRFGQTLLETAAWIETGAWTTSLDKALAEPRDQPAAKLAAEVLHKHLRKIVKEGRELAALSPEARHGVRIRAKKLRYAGDFFASLYGGKAAGRHKTMASLLGDFQDGLGVLNDIATGAELIARLVGAEPDPSGARHKPDPAQAFAAGQVCASREAEAPAAMASALEAYARLAKAKPYW